MAFNKIAATAMNQQPSVDSRSSRTSVWSRSRGRGSLRLFSPIHRGSSRTAPARSLPSAGG